MKKVIVATALLLAALFSYDDHEYEERAQVTVNAIRPPLNVKTVELKFLDFHNLPKSVQREVNCLALNIYREARGESLVGHAAVAFVTLNRVKSELFPETICGVVYQKNPRGCQFSWVCDRKLKRTKLHTDTFLKIKRFATFIYINRGKLVDPTYGALFYHAHYVDPFWNKVMNKTTVIDNHIFYKPRR